VVVVEAVVAAAAVVATAAVVRDGEGRKRW
jgi:hypothetical protein